MERQDRIRECRDMEDYYTSMSLKASKEGDIVKAKEHARMAQIYLKEASSLEIYNDEGNNE